MWINKLDEAKDSVEKHYMIAKMCEELGVSMQPKKIADSLWVVPLFSWYAIYVWDPIRIRSNACVEVRASVFA